MSQSRLYRLADDNDRIIEFEEKTAEPKSNLASMGIYIFNWKRLRDVLVTGYAKGVDMEDFGGNVIPAYIDSGENVFAYRFKGYWKDVGTIDSLHESSMEFLDLGNELDIKDKEWRIYSRNDSSAPQYLTRNANVKAALIDFPLSSLANAHVSSIFMTANQGETQSIFDHMGAGSEWGLDSFKNRYFVYIQQDFQRLKEQGLPYFVKGHLKMLFFGYRNCRVLVTM
ncbi:Nucleotidyl transferase [Lactococcus garvieae]|uniref:Nucleotidyl transferase n=1 Tax=Lactococcus garvieae TaxID=1363 RepID=A0A1I4I223_9LACT|nr:Nucleotidyl transferase [Lactococcus garvieae]